MGEDEISDAGHGGAEAALPGDGSAAAGRQWALTRRAAIGGGATGLAAALLAACGGSSPGAQTTTQTIAGSPAPTVFGNERVLRFTVVCHAKESEIYRPTHNGVADACNLLGASYQWVGSLNGDVTDMIGAITTAVSAKVDGIATSLIDGAAFTAPVATALDAAIPVVAYASDAPGTKRLAYIGSDPYTGGFRMGQRISTLLPGGGPIAVFVSIPGIFNLEERVRGLRKALHGSDIHAEYVASGASAVEQTKTISDYVTRHPSYAGFFAVDGSSTAAVATAINSAGLNPKKVLAGGYDLTPATQQQLSAGVLDFAIDEQPYLQGFLAILELYLHHVSDGLTGAADVDTGVRFVDRTAAAAYANTESRFEGTSTTPGVQQS